ncbi:hypothetical protein K3495_g9195 [Podosphaera aphanis]|nr:hypothetical protein K3495_g9195 [Podosphaera aphanis]
MPWWFDSPEVLRQKHNTWWLQGYNEARLSMHIQGILRVTRTEEEIAAATDPRLANIAGVKYAQKVVKRVRFQ